ncbi:MAG TPA: hypothetical protein VMW27_19330 [Thermoanaerobaculia bacterium]|nr:hypothetical protein [Thermoanaerobaculia bacterium]
MRKTQSLVLLLALAAASPLAAAEGRSGRALVEAAIGVMGGLDLLRSLDVVSVEGIEIFNEMASHDRPGMTLYTRTSRFKEWRDARNSRRRYELVEIGVSEPSQTEIVMNRDVAVRTFGGNPMSDLIQILYGFPAWQQSDEALALAPEQALLAALDAPDLQILPDTDLNGLAQDTLEFRRKDARVRLFLNKDNHFPSAVEITREMPYESFYGELGELTTRLCFSTWWLVADKLRYPLEWNIYFRDRLQRTVLIDKVELNAAADDNFFAVPEANTAAFRKSAVKSIEDYPLGSLQDEPLEVAPGVVFIPGFMNVVLVLQDDGVVVVEAPISCGYSSRVLEEIGRRFPGALVKAVVSTSDAPVHFGGVREYVARSIPVYVRDSNLLSLQELIAAPHKVLLDAYARAPKPPDFRVVRSKVTVGSGPNRLEIYPVHSAGGERSLLVYLPEHRLLYAADLPLKGNGSPFRPFALADAVAQERLAVDRVFGIHPSPTPWQEVGPLP